MLRITRFRASLLATAMFTAAPALAQDTGSMVDQLLPASAKPIDAPADAPVFSVQSATRDEMVGRLGTEVLTRSIDPKTAKARSIVIGAGHEADELAALRPLPSMQVAVAFQGASDALAPESGPLLGTLADALNDPKLASYRFVIGVHTNSVGSDDYNLSLSSLRAKAIVDQLVAVHGLTKGRLYAIGFGRIADGAAGTEPSERIRVVNLGNTAVVPAGTAAATTTAAVVPSSAIKARAHVAHVRRTVTHVVRRRVHVPYADAVEAWPRTRYGIPHSFRRHGATPSDEGQGFGWGYGAPASGSVSAAWGDGFDASGGRRSGGNSGGGGSSSGGGGGGGSSGGHSSGGGSSGGGSSGGGSSGGGGNSGGGNSGGGGGGGGGWSDRRLKRDIRRLGLSPSGLTIYSFRYIWGGPVMVGVMAQDLLLTRSDAVIIGPGGYMQVDYDKIDVKMTTLESWLKTKASV